MGSRTSLKWTEEERQLLQELAGIVPFEQLKYQFNRSEIAIRSYAYKHGIKIKPQYNFLSAREVTRMLGVDVHCLLDLAKKAGIKLNKTSSNGTCRIPCKTLKRLYKEYPNAGLWRKASKETILWLIGDM